ncbi:MAG: FG-GAP repeat domain-containing protein [Myxococcota bacterium]
MSILLLSINLIGIIYSVQDLPEFVDITESAIYNEKPAGSFISIRDYDGDGLDDILIDHRLLKNISYYNISFYDVTDEAGLGDAKGHGTFVDLNGDLCPDIIFYGVDCDIQIYRNDCRGNFIRMKEFKGFENCRYTEAITYLYHNDFYFPIIYCATYEKDNRYFRDYLYATDGDFSFFDVSYLIKSQWFTTDTPSRCAISGDINNDGLMDIYVCNYRLFPNFMFLQRDSGIFTNEAINLDVASILKKDSEVIAGSHTIGAVLSDLNNDGIFEILLANLSHNDYERGYYNVKSQIFSYDRNYKGFRDIREYSGINIDKVGSNINGVYRDELFSNVLVSDFNNDGLKDILFTQVYNTSYSYGRFFCAVSDSPYFVESTFVSIPMFYDSMGAAASDLNRDGCMDIVWLQKVEGTLIVI